MRYITAKGLKNIRNAVEAKDRGTVELPVIPMLALLNDFDELRTIHIKVIYYSDIQLWIAYHDKWSGVGDTHYEAIGRLMCILNAIHKDFTIEFKTEE